MLGSPLAAKRGDASAVDIVARLDAAQGELVQALAGAQEAFDPVLMEELRAVGDDLVVLAASMRDATREGRPPAASPSAAPSEGEARFPFQPDAPAETEPPKPETVSFAASAPPRARPGDEFAARFAASLREDEERIRAVLAEADPNARLSTVPKSGGLRRGTEVEVVFEASDLTVDGTPGGSAKRFEWNGRPQILEFAVTVPANAAPRSVMLKFHVRIEGVVLARVLLGLELANGPVASGERSWVAGRMPATAFASYSSLDRPRVLDRVAAIRIAAGIDVFLDCMDLNPSEEWEPRLKQEIDARDLFILFWSAAAARSRWVTWEWQHAFKTKKKDAMQIQPLENGVRPPRALKAIHFADPYNDLRHAELARRPASH